MTMHQFYHIHKSQSNNNGAFVILLLAQQEQALEPSCFALKDTLPIQMTDGEVSKNLSLFMQILGRSIQCSHCHIQFLNH